MEFSAVIVAAGSGKRAGEGPPKQWRMLGGKPVLRWSVEGLLAAGAAQVIIVVRDRDQALAEEALSGLAGWELAIGGATRSDSVRSGLASVLGGEAVLIHDAARPFVNAHHVGALLAALEISDGAIPVLPVADTLKQGGVTVPRDGLFRAQTPQAFHLDAIRAAYEALQGEPTDDAQVLELAGRKVALVNGDPVLMKLTHPEDFLMAQAIADQLQARVTRMGMGLDAHRFGPGDGVWLCGVKIASDLTLIGHSDADAGLHALTDAILGAIGDGDIGDHFPPTDPQWKGASSDRFLKHAAERVTARGGSIVNVDVTLICEQPRIKPHRQAMRERVAEILALPVDRVSIKATTTEGMGFTGRGEGLAAQAIASVEMPA